MPVSLNVLGTLGDLSRLASATPSIMRLLPLIKEAQAGNQAPLLAYLKDGGWAEIADLIRPGAGSAGKVFVDSVLLALKELGISLYGINANFRVINGAPWDEAAAWLKRQTWGAFVILGPKGQGKTQLALRLGEIWAQRRGYPIEAINMYPEDTQRIPYVRHVGMATFSRRIKALTKYLANQLGEDATLAETADDKTDNTVTVEITDIERLKRKVVILDEASLSIGMTGTDTGRMIARAAMAQARHLDWLVVYVGQLARMLPMDLLGTDCVFVKRPNGREFETDRDEPIVQRLWQQAGDSFRQAPNLAEWSQYNDYRSWAYMDCPTFGTKEDHGYRGLIPFNLAGITPNNGGLNG